MFQSLYSPKISFLQSLPSEGDYGHAPFFDDLFAAEYYPDFTTDRSFACLDLGAGTGRWAEILIHKGHKVHLVDRSRHMLEVARARLTSFNPAQWKVTEGEFREGFDGTAYDAIFLLGNALAHLPDPKAMRWVLKRAGESLREGGYLLLDVHHRDYWSKTEPWISGRWHYWADVKKSKRRYRVWLKVSPKTTMAPVVWENAVLSRSLRFYRMRTEVFVWERSVWESLFASADLRCVSVWGGWDGRMPSRSERDLCFVLTPDKNSVRWSS